MTSGFEVQRPDHSATLPPIVFDGPPLQKTAVRQLITKTMMIKTKEYCPAYLHSSVTVLHSVAFLVLQALNFFQKLVDILHNYKEK